ncbi:MAG TPA: hypothetical protein VGJ75_02455, partial [Dongiaceae bacterium]
RAQDSSQADFRPGLDIFSPLNAPPYSSTNFRALLSAAALKRLKQQSSGLQFPPRFGPPHLRQHQNRALPAA